MSRRERTKKGRGSSQAQPRWLQRALSEKSPLVVVAGVALVPITVAAIGCYGAITVARIANEDATAKQTPLAGPTPSSPDPALLHRERTPQPKSGRDEIRYPEIPAEVSDTWSTAAGEYVGADLYVSPYTARHRPRDGGLPEGELIVVVCQIFDGHPMISSPRYGSPVPSARWYRLADGRWIPDAFVALDDQVVNSSTVSEPVLPLCRPEDR